MKKEKIFMKPKKDYPEISDTVSATECTGMMQTVPQDADEYEADQELYGMELPPLTEENTDEWEEFR